MLYPSALQVEIETTGQSFFQRQGLFLRGIDGYLLYARWVIKVDALVLAQEDIRQEMIVVGANRRTIHEVD